MLQVVSMKPILESTEERFVITKSMISSFNKDFLSTFNGLGPPRCWQTGVDRSDKPPASRRIPSGSGLVATYINCQRKAKMIRALSRFCLLMPVCCLLNQSVVGLRAENLVSPSAAPARALSLLCCRPRAHPCHRSPLLAEGSPPPGPASLSLSS